MFLQYEYIVQQLTQQLGEALTQEVDNEMILSVAKDVARVLNLDFTKEQFSVEDLAKGMRVELEHKDVTKGDPIKTAKIALAHLRERPDYYTLLSKYVEKKK